MQVLDLVGKAQVEHANAFHLIDFGATAYCIFLSHINYLSFIEGKVFVVGDVAELVAEAAGGADGLVNVTVGVAVDPVVDSAVGDVVGQFNGEGAVDAAALELRGNQLIGRYVVGDDDLVLGWR